MNRLLIALCLLAAGKTDTWNPVVSYLVLRQNSQLSDFVTPPQQISTEQSRLSRLPTRSLQNSTPNVYRRPEYRSVEGETDLSIDPTVREYQSKGRLFISRVVPEKMEQPFYKNSNTDPKVKTVEQNYTRMEDKIFFPEDTPTTSDRTPALVSKDTAPGFSGESDSHTTRKPLETVNSTALNVTGISVDDRASFDGDPCPAGYIRVDGKCVEKD